MRSHDRPVADLRAPGQDQYHQCGETQAHHRQNQPGLLLHVLHPGPQGEIQLRSARELREWDKINVNRCNPNKNTKNGMCMRTVRLYGTAGCSWDRGRCLVSFSGKVATAQVAPDKISIWPILLLQRQESRINASSSVLRVKTPNWVLGESCAHLTGYVVKHTRREAAWLYGSAGDTSAAATLTVPPVLWLQVGILDSLLSASDDLSRLDALTERWESWGVKRPAEYVLVAVLRAALSWSRTCSSEPPRSAAWLIYCRGEARSSWF